MAIGHEIVCWKIQSLTWRFKQI